jgi:chemotaxis-related protein WspB
MLYLIFEISNFHYAVSSNSVVEIIPRVNVQKLPSTPEYFSGLMNYRGKPTPIIDFSQLIEGNPSSNFLYTRIIVMKNPHEISGQQLLGIIAEKVTQTSYYNTDEFQDSGINDPRFPFFGKILQNESGIIRLIQIDKLYEMLSSLFLYSKPAG